jgi:hypothetical protein
MTTTIRTFPSSSSSATYTVSRDDAGQLSCDCPGWRFVKPGAERGCKHTRQITEPVSRGAPNAPRAVAPPPAAAAFASTAAELLAARDAPIYRPLMLAEVLPAGRSIDDYDAATWAMEQKYDGVRVLIAVRPASWRARARSGVSLAPGVVTAWSRAGGGRSEGLPRMLPPAIVATLETLPDGDYDGELLGTNGGQRVVLFDILQLGRVDTTQYNYDERRQLLTGAGSRLTADDPVIVTTSGPPSQTMHDAIVAAGGEGVMLKRRAAPYVGRRTADVLKVKGCAEAVVEIVGWDVGKSGPRSVIVYRLPSGLESRCAVLNNDWHRRIDRGEIAIGTRIEIEYQFLMPSGMPRHPRAKRVVGE